MKILYYTYLALKRWRDFRGVASRQELWFFLGPLLMFQLVFSFASSQMIGFDLSLFTFLLFLSPILAIGARRLHDINRSAWLLLIGLIPTLGLIALFVIWCLPSQPPRASNSTLSSELGTADQGAASPEFNADLINEQLLCNNCGTTFAVNDQFCPKCGHQRAIE